MKALAGLWITGVGEVAGHTASLNLAPRYLSVAGHPGGRLLGRPPAHP